VPLKILTSLCAAGSLAGGRDWWPWISLRDEARALAFLLTADVSGAVNLVAPSPATSGTVMHTLATLMHRPYWLPAPAFAIKLLLGQAGTELLLSSQKVIPTKLEDAGFTFRDPTIGQALFISLNSGKTPQRLTKLTD
jgi:NAD dependent epimerase/dehydratase family enzyme